VREQHTILGGKVHVYKRTNSSNWQCSSYLAGRNRRTSTKEESLSKAKEIAEDWYLQLRGKLRTGEIKTEKTFREASEHFLTEYEIITQGQRSRVHVDCQHWRSRVHLGPFFGPLGLSEITAGKVQEYRVHRHKQAMAKFGRPPARNTMHQEIVALRQTLKTAVRNGWLDHLPDLSEPYRSSPKISHRAWFSPEEYKKLYEATRKRAREPLNARYKWESEQLHDYVLFCANTGLRPDEARCLEFRDVTVVEDDATRETILEIEVRGPVVQALQAQTRIAQPRACVLDEVEVGRQARAIIANREVQLPAIDRGRELQAARPGSSRETVPEGVLNDWLQKKRRHRAPFRVGRDGVRHVESITEARSLQFDIALHERGLLRQRGRMLAPPVDGFAQKLAQLEQHRQGTIARPGPNQRRDRVQRVEQEVRLDLQAQRVELCANEVRLETGLAQFETARPVVDSQRCANQEEQAVDEEIDWQGDGLENQRGAESKGLNGEVRLKANGCHRRTQTVCAHDHQTGCDRSKHSASHRHRPIRQSGTEPKDDGCRGRPDTPRTELPQGNPRKGVSVMEHREIDLSRDGQRNQAGGARADRERPPQRDRHAAA
jgi:integrase